ncbi:tyrosine--tRNA ligase [Comamonas sp.]|uniref:tyrosine--tRNA ligase n=1 Tax=Comamonas sp. TaxID=34028 RepID=UPI0028A093B1|nr:tyrosine--tRNA ligase [Comamonas sp.]
MSPTPPLDSDVFALLQERGFVHQCTDEAGIRQQFTRRKVTAYLGFDATADSLHVGHLQGLMLMRWLQKAGHTPLLLIGGATTRIGDPSFRDTSRPVLDTASIAHNMQGIGQAFTRYLGADVQVVDNAQWLDGLGYLEFLSMAGKHFSVNRMLTFDAIRSRLEHSLSFLEFGYTLLQAYDFVELGRKAANLQLYGMTMPLLATSDGKKMGKSAAGAVWLNADRLSPFDFWQFWRNTDDRDVQRFLALFTELPMDEVRRLGCLQGVELNAAKIILANEVTRLAHGAQAATAAAQGAQSIHAAPSQHNNDHLPQAIISLQAVQNGMSVAEVVQLAGLAPSRSEARRLAEGGGLRINGEKVQAHDELDRSATRWVLSAGKKRHVQVIAQ